MAKNREPDPASVQFSWKVRAPKGTAITKKVLKQALDYYLENGEPPRGFEVRAIMWRNPARKGSLADWRWSAGSSKSFIKQIVQQSGVEAESTPRGDHGEAVDTLRGLLQGFEF